MTNLAKTLALAAPLALAASLNAQLAINTLGDSVTIDFDTTLAGSNNGSYAGAGLAPAPAAGQLDSDTWAEPGGFGNTETGTTFANGLGAFGDPPPGSVFSAVQPAVDGNHAFGYAAGNNNPNEFQFRIQNTSGSTISEWDVSFDGWFYDFSSSGREGQLTWASSNDGTNFSTVIADLTIDSTSVATQDSWVSVGNLATSISQSVADGEFLYLQMAYSPVGGGGSLRPGFAVDNFTVATNIPEPGTYALLAGMLALGFIVLRRRK